MNLLYKQATMKILLFSLISALFIIYPDITWLPYELDGLHGNKRVAHLLLFAFRYLFYAGLIFCLFRLNIQASPKGTFKMRMVYNFLISVAAYALYGVIVFFVFGRVRHFGSLVLFQFLVICILSTFIGYVSLLYHEQRQKDQEIEQLKRESLQNRYDALTNQLNPHFFFNSLNGLASLIRTKHEEVALTYINKLSDVFRYILQSEKKGVVTLGEELMFVEAFRYLMEVRFANKLEYRIEVGEECLAYKIPVLSIMPLLDNVVVHNMIDRDHKMCITICLNKERELMVSNPVFPKLTSPRTNGTGLKNLENRFLLLVKKPIRIAHDGSSFRVYLPLM